MLQISYGNQFRPVFESVEYNNLNKHTCLVRPSHLTSIKPQTTAGDIQVSSNVVIPDTSNVRILGPTASTTIDKSGSALKRKVSSSDKGDSLAMVDR